MDCQWGHSDCANLGERCNLCFSDSFHYEPIKKPKTYGMRRRQERQDKRMGSQFEYRNNLRNKAVVEDDVVARLTPNSGAGHIKGDAEIKGIINIMEELKTRVIHQAPGKQSFTIRKEWLEKLTSEAKEASKEFWYLKFSFHESEDDVYVIVDSEVIMSMVATMVQDRRKANRVDAEVDVAKKRTELVEAENAKLLTEIAYLKAQIKEYQLKLKESDHNEV